VTTVKTQGVSVKTDKYCLDNWGIDTMSLGENQITKELITKDQLDKPL
jgi:hypothetical protein